MKKQSFFIIGHSDDLALACFVTRKGDMCADWSEAREWKSLDAAQRHVAKALAAGSDWTYAILPAPPSPAASLGKLAAGVSKKITPQESAARAARMAAARKSRWAKK